MCPQTLTDTCNNNGNLTVNITEDNGICCTPQHCCGSCCQPNCCCDHSHDHHYSGHAQHHHGYGHSHGNCSSASQTVVINRTTNVLYGGSCQTPSQGCCDDTPAEDPVVVGEG